MSKRTRRRLRDLERRVAALEARPAEWTPLPPPPPEIDMDPPIGLAAELGPLTPVPPICVDEDDDARWPGVYL